ncbi:MAG: ribosome-binding factor A [Candidatus Liptonbacteria bacterium]|nr:ribosome-binding factor A [Candidatus Liptonbacteria bacterium]
MNFRPQRLSKLFREHLSLIITREMEFPGAVVTITGLEIDKKIEHAKVLISVWPSDAAAGAIRTLIRAAGHLRYLLMKKIQIKPMPQLRFELDAGTDNADRVERAFLEAEKLESNRE